MNRAVGIERVFSLGNCNMFRVSDTISDIPDYLATDDQFIADLRGLQVLEAEKTFIKYSLLKEGLEGMNENDILEALNASISQKLESIVAKYNQTKGE